MISCICTARSEAREPIIQFMAGQMKTRDIQRRAYTTGAPLSVQRWTVSFVNFFGTTLHRAAQVVQACQPGCEKMEREWENEEEKEIEWGNGEEMERKWGNGEIFTLQISSFCFISSVRSSNSHPDLLVIQQHQPLFQITPVLNTGLSLSEPLQLYKGYNAI